ncbi:FMN-binding protein [Streptomyces sp. NPDC001530]|uniref:FMN-binding protein n=1 Tax=Streptomyces sp. NPDC001530 TaxID=3364582 RepID=UPI003680B378
MRRVRKKHPLRRTVLLGAATVSTIVLLLALKPDTDPATVVQAGGTPAVRATATASPSPSPSASSASPSKSATPKRSSAAPSRSASRSSSAAPVRTTSAPAAPKATSAAPKPATRTVTGATASTKYGPVQVRITLSGSRITGATAVQSPDDTARSRDISSTAVPKLNQETLTAQSADIDTVSGATYTSTGYRQSLQSALDQAGI